MHSLDFLSESPKYFIFQKGANKTNLGGVLFTIYILIMMSISFGYIYDYCTGKKYIVESSKIEDLLDNKKAKELLEKDEFNPEKNFSIILYDYYGKNLSENFRIRDFKTKEIIERGTFFKRRVSDFGFYIEYNCENENCTKRKEDNTYFSYFVKILYQGFRIDHQSKDSPIKNDKSLFFIKEYPFFFNNSLMRTIYWENIRYKEEISGFSKLYYDLIGKEIVFHAGQISLNSDSYILDNTFLGYEKNKTSKLLGEVNLLNILDIITEYKRKKVSKLDLLANIGALSSTIYGIFIKLFSLIYSKNFDNYKIIDKILSQKLKINYNKSKIKNKKEIELGNDFKNSMNDEFSLENKLIINDTEDNYSNYNNNYNIKNMESDSTLPRLRFFDFFINNIYNNRCCYKSNKQELLSICNKILYRYISIDYILYNQIKLENLFKDYKWNNPKLNDIENNDLIIALKNYI